MISVQAGNPNPLFTQASRWRRQRGVAAIAMALLTVGAAGAAMGSFLLYKSRHAQTQAQAQQELRAWAHLALQGFAAAHGRLPCPAPSPDGTENCSSDEAQGWLPAGTLGVQAPSGGFAVLYALKSGSHLEAGNPAGGMGLCSSLQRAASAGESPAPAYGMAVVERGTTGAVSPGPADTLSWTTADELHDALGCGHVAASLDALAMASKWTEDAETLRRDNIEYGQRQAQINDMGVMADGLYTADSMADLANGVYNAADNAARAEMAALNPLLWPYVPVHAGGIAKALSGVALSAVDTARNAGTFALRILHAQAFRDLADAATAEPVWSGSQQMLAQAREVAVATRMPAPTQLEITPP